eukprot:gene4191-3029_t
MRKYNGKSTFGAPCFFSWERVSSPNDLYDNYNIIIITNYILFIINNNNNNNNFRGHWSCRNQAPLFLTKREIILLDNNQSQRKFHMNKIKTIKQTKIRTLPIINMIKQKLLLVNHKL